MTLRLRALAMTLALAAVLPACQESDWVTPPVQSPEHVPAEVIAWLKANAIAFTTSQPGGPYEDLQPLKAIVGDARMVALGEATHGTREFFEMKHRVLEFLVQEMGFTHFAIEAEWAEARRVNEYVHTGRGNPHVWLTQLYLWPWRTQEVLDLIEWMRRYNADPAHPKKVSFVGVDAQFLTLPLDSTIAFLQRADPAGAALAQERYACMRPYANDAFGAVQASYALADPTVQQSCRIKIGEVHAYVADNRAKLEAATSSGEYELALQSARLAVQSEDVRSSRDSWARDRYMAENAAWWLEHGGAGAKLLIWAHNAHVSTGARWMGSYLRAEFGTALRTMGFSFYQGSFTAVNLDNGTLGMESFGPAAWGSYEHFFKAAGMPRFILDLRVNRNTPATQWLNGPLTSRQIGCCHRSSIVDWGVATTSLPQLYDAIIFIENSTPSRLLPARRE